MSCVCCELYLDTAGEKYISLLFMLPFLALCSLQKNEKLQIIKKKENTNYGLKISHMGTLAHIIPNTPALGFYFCHYVFSFVFVVDAAAV